MSAREALKAIQEFAELAVQRRMSGLPMERRTRMDELDEKLRQMIDGAKPRPRTIENPSPKNLKVGGLAQELDKQLDTNVKKKIRDVSTTDLPKNEYTPSAVPAFMADYYDEGMVTATTSDIGGAIPKVVIAADGSEVELMDEVKVLFGLAEPVPPKVERLEPAAIQAARRTSNNTGPQLGRPTIVHFISGGTKRGEIAPFEPHTGKVIFLDKNGEIEEVALDQVLAIFFGLMRGEESTPPDGERLVITLVNDKKVVGVTLDYQEGGDSLTMVPEPKRGNIDRIWIPACAVKAIETA
jgi:hypothetical protein